MHVIDIGPEHATPIAERGSRGASIQPVAKGKGEMHVDLVSLNAGAEIGPHEANFGQLLIVMAGAGWVAGADGVRHAITVGQGAVIARGERHTTGSEMGLIGMKIQISDLGMVAAPRV